LTAIDFQLFMRICH